MPADAREEPIDRLIFIGDYFDSYDIPGVEQIDNFKNIIKYIIKTQENTAKSQVILDSCQKMSSLLHKKLDKEIDNVSKLTAKCDKVKGQRNWLIWLVIALLFWTFRKVIAILLKR